MLRHTIINGVLIRVGEPVRLSHLGEAQGFGKEGDEGVVYEIIDYPESLPRISVVRMTRHLRWGDLDGRVGDHTGLSFRSMNFLNLFNVKRKKITVHNFTTKEDVNLDGEEGILLSCIEKANQCFIEFEKRVGGISDDGAGRNGHCAIVPKECVKIEE